MKRTETSTNAWSGTLFIQKIRSRSPKGYGGCIFSGFEVDPEGERIDGGECIVVRAPFKILPDAAVIDEGQYWSVSGTSSVVTRIEDKYAIRETTIDASTLSMVREQGQMIIHVLSREKKFNGLGRVKARKLWYRFGELLYDILDAEDLDALREVLGERTALALIEGWRQHVPGRFMAFLQAHGFPARLATKFIDFHGKDADRLLREDPYRLVSFSGNWKLVDTLARSVFQIPEDDDRRLAAAVEEMFGRALHLKHTAVHAFDIHREISEVLRLNWHHEPTKALVGKALNLATREGVCAYWPETGLYQALGPYTMERTIGERIVSMIRDPDPNPTLFSATVTPSLIEGLIHRFEEGERSRTGRPFSLNREQRQAVIVAATNRFSVICGAAGTGKTTVLRCIHSVLQALGCARIQMALAGRAAKRMRDVTKEPASTIAGFLRQHERQTGLPFPEQFYTIIDESSMLDLRTTYRILRALPETARITLVGDPYQLPPITAGLIFQILAEAPEVPLVELVQVKRQDDSTGIPAFAAEVRHGRWPRERCPGVRFVTCRDTEIMDRVLALYSEKPDETQILGAVKRCGYSGVVPLNKRCQSEMNPHGRPLLVWDDALQAHCDTGFREGDKVLWTRNDGARDLMNGSLGVITEVFDQPTVVKDVPEPVIAWAVLDGEEKPIYLRDLVSDTPSLDLGYAVTVHKAQGSQFPRVVIPIRSKAPKMLDSTFVYTALTRSIEEVVFVGDEDAVRKAVEGGASSFERVVGLREPLSELLVPRPGEEVSA